jgi:small-conductance mechanosensitive channel
MNWNELIAEPVRQMLTKILAYLPILLGALIILIVGWIVAKLIRRAVDLLLKAVRFDAMADKTGISEVLRKGDLNITAREVISGLVYWLIMIMVLVMTVDALGLPKASDILASLFAYIPKVIAALLVLVVAMFLASFVSGIVRTAAGNANMPKPEMIAGISRWAIIIFAVTIAMEELGIAPLLVGTAFNIILGGVVLALALAFGLGGKDAAAKYLEESKHKLEESKHQHEHEHAGKY